MVLEVNTDAVAKYAQKLREMHKSALPVSVRSALNSAAFDVKKNTMPEEAKSAFVNRSKNFFKANSKVEMAQGFDIQNMKSIVGFVSTGLNGNNNHAVKELEQQEHGGTITHKAFIPMKPARGGNPSKLVRPAARLQSIKKIVNAKNATGKTPGQRFIKSAIYAGKGGFVLSDFKGKEVLWRVNSIRKKKSGALKLTPIYSYEKNRDVNVEKTGFMRRASLASGNKMDKYFIAAATKQLKKLQ